MHTESISSFIVANQNKIIISKQAVLFQITERMFNIFYSSLLIRIDTIQIFLVLISRFLLQLKMPIVTIIKKKTLSTNYVNLLGF